MAKPIFQASLMLLAVMAHLVTAFTPIGQWAQTAVLIGNTIWVYGGARLSNIGITNMYALDVSTSWPYTTPAWIDHSSDAGTFTVPQTAFHTMWPAPDNKSFYVWGGGNSFSVKLALGGFAQYTINEKAWALPSGTAAVSVPLGRRETAASLTSSGVAVIWSGYGDSNTGYNGTAGVIIFDEVIAFDNNKLSWSTLSVGGQTPLPRIEHTATMLPNDQIIMIGGLTGVQINYTYVYLQYAAMTDVPIFDTITLTWNLKNATGNAPVVRRMHTAVLGSDGYSIIICCGGTQSESVNLNDVAVLNTKTLQWTQPNVGGNAPAGRFAPSSILVNGQMLVFFGFSNAATGLDDLAILDTRSTPYQWATNFVPVGTNSSTSSNTSTTTPPPSQSSSSSSGGLSGIGGIGGVIGIAIGALILIALLLFLLIRKPWRGRSHSELPQAPGDPYRGAPPPPPVQYNNNSMGQVQPTAPYNAYANPNMPPVPPGQYGYGARNYEIPYHQQQQQQQQFGPGGYSGQPGYGYGGQLPSNPESQKPIIAGLSQTASAPAPPAYPMSQKPDFDDTNEVTPTYTLKEIEREPRNN